MHKALAEARELVTALRAGLEGMSGAERGEVLICPPVQLLFPMAKAVAGSRIKLGAQNAHFESHGAFTGEVSVPMLKDTGCTHVLIGHSERRQLFHEDGPLLAKKVRAVVAGGLTVVYCVGETLAEREAGKMQAVVERQLSEVLAADVAADRLVVAYEPVWAIGTGKNATPAQAQEVHKLIRDRLVGLYGRGVTDGGAGGGDLPEDLARVRERGRAQGARAGTGGCAFWPGQKARLFVVT